MFLKKHILFIEFKWYFYLEIPYEFYNYEFLLILIKNINKIKSIFGILKTMDMLISF